MSTLTPDLQVSKPKKLSIVILVAKARGWHTKMVRKDLSITVDATLLGREAVPSRGSVAISASLKSF